jgi:lauroyl/myristoyl acyltransferase
VLRRGGLVANAFDVPGDEPTPFLGRDVRLVSGTARLAAETGALVVPVWRARVRWRVITVAGEPLDPRSFADWRALQRALAAVHGGWIRRRPAALEDPVRPEWWAG